MKNPSILLLLFLFSFVFITPNVSEARSLKRNSSDNSKSPDTITVAQVNETAGKEDYTFEEAPVVAKKGEEKTEVVDLFASDKPFPKDSNGARIPMKPGDIPYTLGVDDVVALHVRMHDDLNGEYVVSPEGTIFIPLLGEVFVMDMTKEEVEAALLKELSEYIIDIELNVAITGYRSKYVYVMGEVLFPGCIPMKGNIISLRDAVVEAGLPTENSASWRATIIRPSDVKPYVKHVNVSKLLFSGNLKYDYYLQPDDVVYVPMSISTTFNKYLGQILAPGQTAESITDVIKAFNGGKLFKGPGGSLGRGS